MRNRTLSRLLPPNRTPFEADFVDVIDGVAHDERAIAELYRPQSIPLPLLPWLAWSVDVLAWPRDADETARRRLVAGSWSLHRRQGTVSAFREMAALFGSQITRVITPPGKCFASPALTRAERNVFVGRYPQLRIYRHRTVGARVGLHCGDPLGRWKPVQSDALLRIQPRAYLYRDGVESELTVIERRTTAADRTAEKSTVTEVAIPGAAGRLSFTGRHPRYLTVTEAARRFYRVTLQQTYRDTDESLRRVAAEPGMMPIDVRPDAIAQAGLAVGVHAGQFVARHLMPGTAGDRLYQRLYLFDPEIEVNRRSATLHLNAGRLGMPPHHAELSLRVPGTVSRQTAGRYVRGYLVTTDKVALADCLAAMRNIARASDRIAINTTIKRPVSAGESVLAGSLLAGDWIN